MGYGVAPGGWAERKPRSLFGVDWTNPFARGLNIRVPLGVVTRNIVDGFAPQTASSGHKIAASAAGLVSAFDGTQNGIVHTFTAPSFPITISARIFAAGVGGGAVVALTGPAGGDNWWTHTLEVSATQIFSNTAAGGGTDISINYTLPAVGRWYDAALVVASATDRRLYIDGLLVGSSTASRSFPNFAEARIGSIGGNWAGSSKLVGQASDVNVWRRALALPEIRAIAANPWQLDLDEEDPFLFSFGTSGILRPSADLVPGGWTATPSGPLYDAINEATASDTDYITSPDLATPAVFALSASAPAGSFNVRVRASRSDAAGQVRVRFLDESNTDVGGTAWQTLTNTPTTYTLSATTTATATRARIEVQP